MLHAITGHQRMSQGLSPILPELFLNCALPPHERPKASRDTCGPMLTCSYKGMSKHAIPERERT